MTKHKKELGNLETPCFKLPKRTKEKCGKEERLRTHGTPTSGPMCTLWGPHKESRVKGGSEFP